LQANSVPAAFWTLAMLLLPSNSHLVAEIRAAAPASDDQLAQQAVQVTT